MKVGSDFSGVGAFDQALRRLNIEYQTEFSCDMDKYARQTYIENYGKPKYYPENVYDREIPIESLDIYMTSPPCQSFSLAGKRKGEDSANGVLFYNSHEFIMKNNPRYFIFENVKGLLSDAKGRTFQTWIDMLGGKSVNGNPVIFPREDSAPYHVYYKVLNAKNYGVPQNRERVFIIGIRDDCDNTFQFPKPFHLTKRLKDVLEYDVLEKYFLSDKLIKGFLNHKDRHEEKGTGFKWQPKNENDIGNALRANGALCPTDNSIQVNSENKKGYVLKRNLEKYYLSDKAVKRIQKSKFSQFFKDDNTKYIGCLTANYYKIPTDGNYIKVNSATKKGYEKLETLDTQCNESFSHNKIRRLTPRECFRLMDFPDTFKMPCSNSQMYKQAGNSIVVNVLSEIINKLNL